MTPGCRLHNANRIDHAVTDCEPSYRGIISELSLNTHALFPTELSVKTSIYYRCRTADYKPEDIRRMNVRKRKVPSRECYSVAMPRLLRSVTDVIVGITQRPRSGCILPGEGFLFLLRQSAFFFCRCIFNTNRWSWLQRRSAVQKYHKRNRNDTASSLHFPFSL